MSEQEQPVVENIQPQVVPPAPAPEKPDYIMEEFDERTDKPNAAQIEQWKQQHGEVHLFGLDANEMYIFRPLRRLEYRNMRKQAQDDESFRETVVNKVVLWPDLDITFSASCKAGTIDTLFDMIMLHSNFLSPEMAVGLVRKL